MARPGRNTIQKRTNQADTHVDYIMMHLRAIDDIYSGVNRYDEDGEELEMEFTEISDGEPYQQYREYVALCVTMLEQFREFLLQIKTF